MVLTSDLHILHEFDWRGAIGVDYSEVIDDSIENPAQQEQNPLKIAIRPNVSSFPQSVSHHEKRKQ